jgi:hypothetical protein
MGKKTEQVIRRVVIGKTYNVFSFATKNGIPDMKLLEVLKTDSENPKPTDAELCTKHKVDKVMLMTQSTTTGYYGVPVDKFMEIATLVETKTKDENEVEETVPVKESK